MKSIRNTTVLFIVCCLLFGSLTLGSVTLSSCSPKNNPASRVAELAEVKKQKAENEESKQNAEEKQNKHLVNISKGATWGSFFVANSISLLTNLVILSINTETTTKTAIKVITSNLISGALGWFIGSAWNKRKGGGNLTWWSGLPGLAIADIAVLIHKGYLMKHPEGGVGEGEGEGEEEAERARREEAERVAAERARSEVAEEERRAEAEAGEGGRSGEREENDEAWPYKTYRLIATNEDERNGMYKMHDFVKQQVEDKDYLAVKQKQQRIPLSEEEADVEREEQLLVTAEIDRIKNNSILTNSQNMIDECSKVQKALSEPLTANQSSNEMTQIYLELHPIQLHYTNYTASATYILALNERARTLTTGLETSEALDDVTTLHALVLKYAYMLSKLTDKLLNAIGSISPPPPDTLTSQDVT